MTISPELTKPEGWLVLAGERGGVEWKMVGTSKLSLNKKKCFYRENSL